MDVFVLFPEIVGTIAFAVSGSMLALQKNMGGWGCASWASSPLAAEE